MKILLDHDVPHQLRRVLPEHEDHTAAYLGWSELENGELLEAAASDGYDLVITCDQGKSNEQNLDRYDVTFITIMRGDWTVIRLKTDDGWSAPRDSPGPGCGRGHGVPHQAVLPQGWARRRTQGPSPSPPVPELDERAEAHPIALACSLAPEGHDHWELCQLADRLVELGVVESLSHETVRLHLKTPLSRCRRKSGASPE